MNGAQRRRELSAGIPSEAAPRTAKSQTSGNDLEITV